MKIYRCSACRRKIIDIIGIVGQIECATAWEGQGICKNISSLRYRAVTDQREIRTRRCHTKVKILIPRGGKYDFWRTEITEIYNSIDVNGRNSP